ncbi:MAG: glutamate--tRNA ligase [bacterium]|nr:glutamate--tRNA ligase [bacterium]
MTAKKTKIRCRLAPSPTGMFTLGNARTALFNWLFARHAGGIFVLRIENTDESRSDDRYEKEIIEGLAWLNINWDEGPDIGGPYGPYRQSERTDIYEKYLKRLLEENKAYYCYCTKEELETERQAQLAQGLAPKYSGKCRALTVAPGGVEPQVIRFKTPETKVTFKDLIRGHIQFDMGLTGDIVIAKNIISPLYNFAVVVDDFEMNITHVIRGEDHIANTPKQILFQKALDMPTPHYGHLPLILNADRSKLSKRYAETSLLAYRDQGYLREALVNFMALLGWHPKDDREIFTLEELAKEFELERVQKAGAVFDERKLAWLNAQYIKNTPTSSLIKLLKPFENVKVEEDILLKVIELEKGRVETLKGMLRDAEFFFNLEEYDSKILMWKNGTQAKTKENLVLAHKTIEDVSGDDFTEANLQKILMAVAEKIGRGDLLWPLRVALSGKTASPGPFEIMAILGKTESLKRIDRAIHKL